MASTLGCHCLPIPLFRYLKHPTGHWTASADGGAYPSDEEHLSEHFLLKTYGVHPILESQNIREEMT
jgi:hypothetical protein